MPADGIIQGHVDDIAAALKLVPDGNFDAVTKAYMSLGWLKSEVELAGMQEPRVREIDRVEEDAIRISDRQGLTG